MPQVRIGGAHLRSAMAKKGATSETKNPLTMKRLRRTMMFVPGNNPGMMQDAYIYGPDSIMLDLEDSVTLAEKDAARLLVYHALQSVDSMSVRSMWNT